MDKLIIEKINVRYSELAVTDTNLSCGKAVSFINPQPGAVVVDLGSGKGRDVITIAQKIGQQGRVYGIDISDGMIKQANQLKNEYKITNAQFIQSELEEIPLQTGSVDHLISNCTLNHVKDKQKTWNEIYRILKQKGECVVSDIYAVNQVPQEYAQDPSFIAECWAGASTKDEYIKILQNAGFDTLTILNESKPYAKGNIEVCSFTFKVIK